MNKLFFAKIFTDTTAAGVVPAEEKNSSHEH